MWALPPETLSLAAPEVHVWLIDLTERVPSPARTALSEDEEHRAERFRFPHLTRRFVAARAALRAILGRYCGADPAEIAFAYSPSGKPSLAGRLSATPIAFNLSHAGDLALCAVTAGRDIGVDIEWIRRDRDPFESLGSFFSAAERAVLETLEAGARVEACYACWTRKEAYLKARGDGLAIPLDAFDVSCAPGEPARLLATRGPAADGRRWTILDLGPIEGFAGAAAVEGAGVQTRRWRWTWRSR